uniref:NADH dehydrogenase subunit 6 n=1 Tax=Ledropsis sp. 1 XYW-2023a TaxID=3078463 RepID=A0AB38ZHA5_9HEMI
MLYETISWYKGFIVKAILVLCSFSCFMKNPMSMGLLLMFYSFFVSFLIGSIMLTSWFCIIIMLMMIGGLLVIFMYISSISSNEKFKVSLNLFFVLMFIIFPFEEFLFEFHSFDYINMLNDLDLYESFFLVSFYNKSCFCLTAFMVFYLIFTMIVVSSVVKHFKGPLRSFKYE